MQDNDANKKKGKSKIYYTIVVIIAVLLIAATIFVYMYISNKKNKEEDKDVAYTELIKDISEKEIEKIEMTVGSTSLKVKYKDIEKEKSVIVPSTQAFIELVQEEVKNGSQIELIQKPANKLISVLQTILTFLPTLMIVALFYLVIKMQGLGDKGKVYEANRG